MCVWLYKLLYELYELKTDDNNLYKAIITFLLVNNQHIFSNLLEKIKFERIEFTDSSGHYNYNSWTQENKECCLSELIYFFSDGYSLNEDSLTPLQKKYIGNSFGRINYEPFKIITDSNIITHNYRHISFLREGYARLLYKFLEEIIKERDYIKLK